MDFIHEGLWPYTQNKETKRYRWHFEDPDGPGAEHHVVEEHLVNYKADVLIVVRVESPERTYHVVLGRYDKEGGRYIKVSNEPVKERKNILDYVTTALKITGFVDL